MLRNFCFVIHRSFCSLGLDYLSYSIAIHIDPCIGIAVSMAIPKFTKCFVIKRGVVHRGKTDVTYVPEVYLRSSNNSVGYISLYITIPLKPFRYPSATLHPENANFYYFSENLR